MTAVGRFLNYKPQFPFVFETDQFRIRTAYKTKDFYRIFKLRYQCFLGEGAEGLPYHLDVDEYDTHCDHIIIQEKSTKKIIGTYRVLCSLYTDKYYSESEFEMGEFLKLPGIKLELGRACIHPKYRNGQTINLLWKGISNYIQLTNSRYLFGCSSVDTTDPHKAVQFINYLKSKDLWSDEYSIRPYGRFDTNLQKIKDVPILEKEELATLMPPLLRTYISAGAKVYGIPALDLDFSCMDFFTIMDLRKLNPLFKKRYF